MMQSSVWKRGAAFVAGLLVLCALTPLFQSVTHAAPPRLDDIRVALFIQARGSVPSVTLSSPNGLILDERTPAGARRWTDAPSTVRFALDQPMVELMRTANYETAAQLRSTLGASGESAFIFARPSASGAAEYIVAAGPYAGYGNLVKIRHADGTVTLYGHLSSILVNVGQRVWAGIAQEQAQLGERATGQRFPPAPTAHRRSVGEPDRTGQDVHGSIKPEISNRR